MHSARRRAPEYSAQRPAAAYLGVFGTRIRAKDALGVGLILREDDFVAMWGTITVRRQADKAILAQTSAAASLLPGRRRTSLGLRPACKSHPASLGQCGGCAGCRRCPCQCKCSPWRCPLVMMVNCELRPKGDRAARRSPRRRTFVIRAPAPGVSEPHLGQQLQLRLAWATVFCSDAGYVQGG